MNLPDFKKISGNTRNVLLLVLTACILFTLSNIANRIFLHFLPAIYSSCNANTSDNRSIKDAGASANEKIVYLTFDDGPGPYTEELLGILKKYNVKATFFTTNIHSDYQQLIAMEAQDGHTVAAHSASHNYSKIYANPDAFFKDLNEIADIIENQTGSKPKFLRFPGGSSNTTSKKYCYGIMNRLVKEVENQGYIYVDWNVSSGDAESTKNTDVIFQNVIHGIQTHDTSIVLMHDTRDYSVAAVESILKWGIENGYTFLPLDENSPICHHHVKN